jgi:phosphomannomutase
MASAPLPLEASPIQFGTDGWRGILGIDIAVGAPADSGGRGRAGSSPMPPAGLTSREVVIGYDRRFLAPELAEAIAAAVRGADLEPLLSDTPVPTPPAAGRWSNGAPSAPW